MATLYVRDVPEDLYTQLRLTAQASNRSIGAATIEILRRELADRDELDISDLLGRARRVRSRSRPASDSPTVADDIRQDRER